MERDLIIYEIANSKVVGICEMMRTILAEREFQHLKLLQRIHRR